MHVSDTAAVQRVLDSGVRAFRRHQPVQEEGEP